MPVLFLAHCRLSSLSAPSAAGAVQQATPLSTRSAPRPPWAPATRERGRFVFPLCFRFRPFLLPLPLSLLLSLLPSLSFSLSGAFLSLLFCVSSPSHRASAEQSAECVRGGRNQARLSFVFAFVSASVPLTRARRGVNSGALAATVMMRAQAAAQAASEETRQRRSEGTVDCIACFHALVLFLCSPPLCCAAAINASPLSTASPCVPRSPLLRRTAERDRTRKDGPSRPRRDRCRT